MRKPIPIHGKVFGRLTVIDYAGQGKWLCKCSCGATTKVITQNLKKGNTTSCGCAWRQKMRKHGLSSLPLYRTWVAMRHRCNNPHCMEFKNYGGRGIKVDPRWDDFAAFLADMGMRPKGCELDRIENDGPYSKENCRWVPKRVNLNNKRTNHFLEFNGKRQSLAEWAAECGITYNTLANRVNRGWPLERALTEPVNS